MIMKKEVTLGNLLSILVPLFVLVLGWGISINSRLDVFGVEISTNEETIKIHALQIEKVDDKIDKNFKIMHDKLDKILYMKLDK